MRQRIRVTNLDPKNEPMQRMAKEVALCYTKTLYDPVRQMLNPSKSSLTSTMPTLTLQCAHDCIVDPVTHEKIAPHFVANCVELCNHLADSVTKDKFGESETQPYVMLAVEAKKEMQRRQLAVKKSSKWAARVRKKVKVGLHKSGTNSVIEAEEAVAKATNAVIKAESGVKQAEKDLEDATKRADVSIHLRSAVIKCWSKPLEELVKAASHATPDCVAHCRLILPPGSDIRGQRQCTCAYYVYIIQTGFRQRYLVCFHYVTQVKNYSCLYV